MSDSVVCKLFDISKSNQQYLSINQANMKIAENRPSILVRSDESPKVDGAHKKLTGGVSGFKIIYNQTQKTSTIKEGSDELRTIKPDETLTGIIKDSWKAKFSQSTKIDEGQAYRLALRLAKDNNISDANFILPGRIINMNSVLNGDINNIIENKNKETINKVSDNIFGANEKNYIDNRGNKKSILEIALDRAVKKGYIPQQDRVAIQDRIFQMAHKHKFQVDDLAQAVLMESDGFNPAASNGFCFGIIQFCSGSNSGAASVGYANRPMDINKLSVLQQLELVDKYFDDTHLNQYASKNGYVNLDDLYLTILTPAAREEKDQFKPLPIPGVQALALHPGKNRDLPITRDSIVNGLNEIAQHKLKNLNRNHH